MSKPVLGTAHLFGLVDEDASRALLARAASTGFRRIDTAPSYGHGRAEAEVGRTVRDTIGDDWTVTTKVGIAAVAEAGFGVRVVKGAARRLPGSVQRRLRGDRPPGGGQFDAEDVRASIARSLQRLGSVDRLMLHEARPDDITPELLAVLRDSVAGGGVRAVGLATSNEATPACLAIEPGLFSVVHLAVGIRAELPQLPGRPIVVGHGAFGAAGGDLAELVRRLNQDVPWARQWRAATGGTRWAGDSGLADALVVRACGRTLVSDSGTTLPVDDLIVASSDAARLERLRSLVDESPELDTDIARLLDPTGSLQD